MSKEIRRAKEHRESKEMTAAMLLRGDYLNEWIPKMLLLNSGGEVVNKIRTFSERYREMFLSQQFEFMQLSITPEDQKKITELDRLCFEANTILVVNPLNIEELKKIYKQVKVICD
jgi:hypothetical protein